MAQVLYPEDRQVVDQSGRPAPLAQIRVYADDAASVPAVISLTEGGAAVTGSVLTADADGRVPLFWAEAGGLTCRAAAGGPVSDLLPRLDELIVDDTSELPSVIDLGGSSNTSGA